MRALTLALMLAFVLAFQPVAPALADEAPGQTEDEDHGAPGTAYCEAVARTCGVTCSDATDPGSAAAAACQARCAIERAACDARDSLSGVEPWLADKADKMDSFMEGFHGNHGDRYIEEPNLHHDDEQDGAPNGEAGEAAPGTGGGGTAANPLSCGDTHAACEHRCETWYPEDAYARAGCESVCSLDRATCEANAGVEAAKPFIERETNRLRDFFGGFLNDEGEAPPPPPPELGSENPDGSMTL